MTTRKWYHLFVDGEHFKTIKSGWPIGRIMAQLTKIKPDAKNLEVRLHDEESSLYRLSF